VELGITAGADGSVPAGPVPVTGEATISLSLKIAIGIPTESHGKDKKSLPTQDPDNLGGALDELVSAFEKIDNEAKLRIQVMKFLVDHKVKVAITVGGEVGGGFGISGDSFKWGFSKRAIFGQNIEQIKTTKHLRIGVKADAKASALNNGAQADCEFSIGIFGGGEHSCKLTVDLKFLNVTKTYVEGASKVEGVSGGGKEDPGEAPILNSDGVEAKASVELFVSASYTLVLDAETFDAAKGGDGGDKKKKKKGAADRWKELQGS